MTPRSEGPGSRPWSSHVRALWGKTGDGDTWLPLWRHLEDSAYVAGLLWDHWLPVAAKEHVADALPGAATDGRILVTWLAGVHDIGKATPSFAVKAPMLTGRMRDLGFTELDFPLSESSKAPHGALGYVLLREWLEATFPAAATPAARGARSSLAVAVGAHHGVLPGAADIERIGDDHRFRGRGSMWGGVQVELLEGMAARTGAADRIPDWLAKPLPPTVQALVAAVVVAADWLASDERRFPYDASPAERPTWAELGLPDPWSPAEPPLDAAELLHSRFPALGDVVPSPIQRAAAGAAWSATRPPLLLLEAEMGSGKTEAGLATAEILAHRFGQGGVFVALPTMATSDAMFGRVRDWIDHIPTDGGHTQALTMFLAHGKAGLNDDYRGLPEDQQIAGVYDEDDDTSGSGRSTAGELRHAVATVNSWTRGRRKGVLAPFVVGTIDQVLFGALRSKHLALRHLALASKVVVIDEVHAADVYMREYLTSALAWLGAYSTPVVLMSATLPTAQRAQLIAAYAEGVSYATKTTYDLDTPPRATDAPRYPTVTLLDDAVHDVPAEQTSSRPRTVIVEEHPDDLDHLVTTLREELAEGGCAAVVRNTVARAQGAWEAFRAALPDAEVVLVHSRFLSVDRARREASLRARLGRQASTADGTRPHRLIVVGTQVLEQSLDIDVDLMVSDLAPIDLLLQRVGRLHRHPRGPGEADRPERLRTPRLLLTGADWSVSPVLACAGSRRVYRDASLLRAAATLRARERTIRLAEDIPRLVETAYDPRLEPPPGWEDAWATAEDAEHIASDGAQSKARAFLLSGFAKGLPLRKAAGLLADCGFFEHGEADDGNGGRSQVRDSEDSLEVVVVRRLDGVLHPMPGTGLPEDTVLATDFAPEPRVARTLAGCTVRLPSWTILRDPDAVIRALEDTSPVGWQQDCPWLQGQLVLVLDENGRARVADIDIAYDPDTGLTVTTHREDR